MQHELLNHLWQSTAFAAVAALVCAALRNHSPRLRYWLWLAASAKFLLPFSLLMAIGGQVDVPAASPRVSAIALEQATLMFAPLTAAPPAPSPAGFSWQAVAALAWAAGFLMVVAIRFRQWLHLAAVRRAATPVDLPFPVPAMATQTALEPGIFGVFRPVLLIPDSLLAKLSAVQLDAILAHERCHVRYRDNLTAALHMGIEAAFWFHPLVWWLGARLVDERERHCDESVISEGGAPAEYAGGILAVCRHYASAPLPCASGVTGSDLKRRIHAIMTHRISARLGVAGSAALAAVATVAVTLPLALGVLRAQNLPPAPKYGYEVATIRPSKATDNNSRIGPGPQGGMRAVNVTAMSLLRFAYDIQPFQFVDVPDWVGADRFDLTFTPDTPEKEIPMPGQKGPMLSREEMEAMFNRQRQRLQAVLRDRFGLVLRAETRDMSKYALVVAKDGHKLKNSEPGSPPSMRVGHAGMQGRNVYFSMIANSLSSLFERHVDNETGLDGPFDFEMKWSGDPESTGPSEADRAALISALPEQLGLRLESRKGPVPVFVIEKITKPSEN